LVGLKKLKKVERLRQLRVGVELQYFELFDFAPVLLSLM